MDIHPVDQLLCDCLGRISDEVLADRLDALAPSEWEALVEHAENSSVAPLLYRRLETLRSLIPLPANMLGRLRAVYLGTAVNNTLIYDAARQMLVAMKAATIDVIALKGIYLAECVYKNIALRPMSDIDILVRKDDLSSTVEVLKKLGYAPSEPFRIKAACAAHHHLPPFVRSNSPSVEIHWAIEKSTSPFLIDLDGLWQRAQPVKIVGVDVLSLSAVDTLLHLCLHAAYSHSLRFGLRVFCDISEILGYFQDRLDWEEVSGRATQWGIDRYVYLMLYLSKRLFEMDVPEKVLQSLKPIQFDETIVLLARDRIFQSDSGDGPPLPCDMARLWSDIKVSRKAAVLLKRLLTPPTNLGENYRVSSRSWRRALYFPIRLMDLLRRHSITVWKLIRRDKEMMGSFKRKEQVNRLSDWLSRP